jgi:hypothetical protein
MQKSEDVLVCPKCGGVHFQEAEFRQYHEGTYSAIPGGEPYLVPQDGPRVRVCLCGHPVPIATRAVEERRRENFAASLQMALAYRNRLDANALEAAILQFYADKQDALELNQKLAHLLQIVNGPDYVDAHSAVSSKSKQKTSAPAELKSDGIAQSPSRSAGNLRPRCRLFGSGFFDGRAVLSGEFSNAHDLGLCRDGGMLPASRARKIARYRSGGHRCPTVLNRWLIEDADGDVWDRGGACACFQCDWLAE